MKCSLQLSSVVLLMFISSFTTASQTISDGSYFGQTLPGDSAVVFAPGTISVPGVLCIAFSPAGDELCVSMYDAHQKSWLFYSKLVGLTWSKLDTAYFATDGGGGPVSFSPDGQLLTFMKLNPVTGWPNNTDLYFCARTDTGWSQPRPFPTVINSEYREAGHALTFDRTLYYSSGRPADHGCDVYKAMYVNGEYPTVEYVSNLSTVYDEDGIWVSPDESYAIVESWPNTSVGGKDLYISFHKQDGSWTALKNMGPKINSSGPDVRGKVTPDGKYLFYTSRNAIYWIQVDKIRIALKKDVFSPVVSKPLSDVTVKTDSLLNYVIPANTFTCEYGVDSLTYTATLSNGSALPPWLIFNSKTRTLSGIPAQPEVDTLKITATNADTVRVSCIFRIVVRNTTDIEEKEALFPQGSYLHQNYPNPFNPSTTIRYSLHTYSSVTLSIYNLLGQKIRTLLNSFQPAGDYSLTWDATDDNHNSMSSGIYFYRLEAKGRMFEKKMLLIR